MTVSAPDYIRNPSQYRQRLLAAQASFIETVGDRPGIFAVGVDLYHVRVFGQIVSRSKLLGWVTRGWLRRVGSTDRGVAYETTEESPR